MPTQQAPIAPTVPAMDPTYQAVFTVAMFVAIAVLGGYALRLYRRTGTPVPLLLMAGGFVAMLSEPIVDVMGLCAYPGEGMWTLFTTFGRPVPVFMVVYVWFVGGQALLVWQALERGGGSAAVWRWLAIFFVVDVSMETVAVRVFRLYVLYGAQPFSVFGLPWWWILVNVAMPVVTGVVVYRALPLLPGMKVLGVIALVPMTIVGVNASTSFAMWNALHTDAGYRLTYPVGLLTIGLTLFLVWLAARAADAPTTTGAPVEQRQPVSVNRNDA
jgi:hypothetical protein